MAGTNATSSRPDERAASVTQTGSERRVGLRAREAAEPLVTLPERELLALVEAAAERGAERALSRVHGLCEVDVWLTPKQLADKLGVSLRYVYDHAEMLGVERLGPKGENAGGNARKPRLRFDLETARAALSRYGSEHSHDEKASADGASAVPGRWPSSSLASHRPKRGHVLQSRPRKAAR